MLLYTKWRMGNLIRAYVQQRQIDNSTNGLRLDSWHSCWLAAVSWLWNYRLRAWIDNGVSVVSLVRTYWSALRGVARCRQHVACRPCARACHGELARKGSCLPLSLCLHAASNLRLWACSWTWSNRSERSAQLVLLSTAFSPFHCCVHGF